MNNTSNGVKLNGHWNHLRQAINHVPDSRKKLNKYPNNMISTLPPPSALTLTCRVPSSLLPGNQTHSFYPPLPPLLIWGKTLLGQTAVSTVIIIGLNNRHAVSVSRPALMGDTPFIQWLAGSMGLKAYFALQLGDGHEIIEIIVRNYCGIDCFLLTWIWLTIILLAKLCKSYFARGQL